MIVLDDEFEPDHSILFAAQPNDTNKSLRDREIGHGTVVSATAASINERSGAMASGATVYPINALPLFYMNPQQQALLEHKEDQLNALRKAFNEGEEVPYIQKIKALDAEAKKYNAAGNLDENKRVLAEREQCIKEHQEIYNHYGSTTGILLSEIKEIRNKKKIIFDRLAETIECCIANKQPIPYVINMSLGFNLNDHEANLVVESLTRLFRKHDVLLVTSAGNDSSDGDLKYIGQKCEDNSGKWDIKKLFLNNPAIRERVIFVMAADLDQCADFSTRSGMARNDTLITFGYNLNTSTYSPDGSILRQGKQVCGTSVAAPRVAAAAIILKKYFPELTMTQIKGILLETAVNPKSSEEDIGRGSLNPLEAWKAAVKMTTPAAPILPPVAVENTGVIATFKRLFGIKK